MLKENKVAFVERVSQVFKNNDSFVLLRASGIDTGKMTRLRFALNASGAKLLVVKNSLAHVALRNMDSAMSDSLSPYLSHAVAMAYSNDVVSLSKAMCDFARDKKKGGADIIGGFFQGNALDRLGVERMSTMPSLDQMRAMVVAILGSRPRELISSLQYHPMLLIRVLELRRQQLDS